MPSLSTALSPAVPLSSQAPSQRSAPFPQHEPFKDRSSLVSRNVTIGSHRTSIRLKPDMWNGLREICRREHVTIHDIATVVAIRKPANSSLTAAMRVFVMAYFRSASTEEGHSRAGHGPGGSFMESLMSRRSEEQNNTRLREEPKASRVWFSR